MSLVYSSSYLFWAIYGSEVDIPAFLNKLVGLGYEVGKAYYRSGSIQVEPLPGGYAARRVYEEGEVKIYIDTARWAVGTSGDNYQLTMRGVADISRAFIELSFPEPPRAEFHTSIGLKAENCRRQTVKIGDVEMAVDGYILTTGQPQGGEGIYIAITPTGGGRYIAYIIVGGSWSYVVTYAKRIGDIINGAIHFFTSCN
ncbi:hypothetical protein Pisl_0190 [Pyrobaculum islandicum DSM 4184]|uniref:Uncharacterized protein n=1 Tax=Pyrobaculum islandicum (strain DSM 4184 / JCM 9189 / GEO3) TaxID=384616 RepID=A1RQZ0_PYRIL|nr:hypothetical protein [Pyrobaculum islandicum]ABL87372.1 hypothetical protein Pisl_0190 [Pyrobaculum islandicum DSM 4184]